MALTVFIQREQIHTVKDTLLHISRPSSVQKPRSHGNIDASQQAPIETASLIRVLHLMHFLYDKKVNNVAKIGNRTHFGLSWNFAWNHGWRPKTRRWGDAI
ncbi:hypothetical protein FIBSPDRAFT_1054751 [Athelia psychrophila]|uniref:Uncharacterized protein n=1 Tax=Athelia psychrophila TaxID=1759441 RepID=A0A167UVB9_9AGAM|nr:hypothetical protein FIBSPDRAFT_1054751 [Fibularhizoctonia sp. CBS 109695]